MHDVRIAFAHATQTVFYIMAAVLAVNFVVARVGLPGGSAEAAADDASSAARA